MKVKLTYPTPEEDAAINAAIASDPDTYEITEEIASRMRPLRETDPELLARIQAFQAKRGRPLGATKNAIKISLDAELVEVLRASGKGWQTRVNATLREVYMGKS